MLDYVFISTDWWSFPSNNVKPQGNSKIWFHNKIMTIVRSDLIMANSLPTWIIQSTHVGLGGRWLLLGLSNSKGSCSVYLEVGMAIGWLVVQEWGTLPTSQISKLILLFVFRICTASSCVASSKLCPLTSRIWSPTYKFMDLNVLIETIANNYVGYEKHEFHWTNLSWVNVFHMALE